MTEVIKLSGQELHSRISNYETKWSDFAEVYDEPTCCPGCMIPYERWGLERCNDWATYTSLRWLRGDEITWEDEDD